MDDVKNFIEDIGIAAFEANIKIAGLAVVSNSGELIYYTENWEISNQIDALLNLLKGENSIILQGQNFIVVKANNDGIIATSESGMGHVILVPFQKGILISYAIPQADPNEVLDFLKQYVMGLNSKI
ncbi:MAG: hypothetical protein ACFE9R_09495 [Candidatus Hermodarchaeota archaeon]